MEERMKRHGCLTSLLVLILVVNIYSAISYLIGGNSLKAYVGQAYKWLFPLMCLLSLFNLICVVALLKWKKWGFWGMCGSAVIGSIANLYIGLSFVPAISGLIGIVILFAVLHAGEDIKGWERLE